MKRILAIVLLACGVGTTIALAAPAKKSAASVADLEKPLAVLIYADWCYNCKQIKPRLALLDLEYSDRILFTNLDVTNEERKAKTREKAKALGIAPLYFSNKGTGVVLLVNRQREKVGELRYTLGDAEMRAALDALVAGKPVPAPKSVPAAAPKPAAAL